MPEHEKAALTIAFICAAESGQANIHFATLEHLLSLGPEDSPPLHLHLLTFGVVKKRALALPSSERHTFTFHELGDVSYYNAVNPETRVMERHPPAALFRKGGLRTYAYLAECLGTSPDYYVQIYERILEVFEEVEPKVDLAAIDVAMAMGPDACQKAGVKYGVMTPQGSLDCSRYSLSSAQGFWKYPAPWSGIPYPLRGFGSSLYNIGLSIGFIHTMFTSPFMRALDKRRKAAGIPGPTLRSVGSGLPFVVCSSILELEYPHTPPANFVMAGPMLVDVPALDEHTDPSLGAFFAQGPTIVINMGSLFEYHEADVRNFAQAIVKAREATRESGAFRVLWKIPKWERFAAALDETLGSKGEDRDAVRIEGWIEPPSLAVLQHKNVVASVNHGGANSVHEAAYAGCPQIILPQWMDLYDYAARVEYLNIGTYANKGHPAEIDADQLAQAFVQVLGEDGRVWRDAAERISKACRKADGLGTVTETLLKAAASS